MDSSQTPPVPPHDQRSVEAKVRLELLFLQSASLFYWIGALSVINYVLSRGEVSLQFPVGLALVDLAVSLGGSAAGSASAAVLSGLFGALGYLGRRRMLAPYWIGISLYGLDAVLSLVLLDVVGLLFHALFLVGLGRGRVALRQLERAERGEITPELLRSAGIPVPKDAAYWVKLKRFAIFAGALMAIPLVLFLILLLFQL